MWVNLQSSARTAQMHVKFYWFWLPMYEHNEANAT